ncbi:MAG: GNAT family N-acetyltransferase [Alphaproteobacteria bacterium]|jgi:ribosomal protein S18 acetylase RimI-like enzyme|nr:GNAT family N-acetyltransferase [Alphaproteobacteria bacterium]|tara:strand:+ start:1012 stop:1521 length:510 start_codon:yes stop_codon:yes gene_type:complete
MGLPRQITTPIDYQVRLARIGDIGAIQTTARASWTAAYAAILAPPTLAGYLARGYGAPALQATLRARKSTFLVAVRGASVLGFCHFGERGRGSEVFQLYVHPRLWSRGIGRRLLSHAEMRFQVAGARRYGLTVLKGNEQALLFYADYGFERDRKRDSRDEWHLVKTLGP